MVKIKTPKGMASNLWLVRPDTKFIPDGVYRAGVTLHTSEATELIEICKEEAVKAFGPKGAARVTIPGKANSAGTVTFVFRNRSKPDIYDSRGIPIAPAVVESLQIGDGSIIRVAGRTEPYKGFGGGVAVFLHAVQVIQLVRNEDSVFEPDAEGTFFVADYLRQGW